MRQPATKPAVTARPLTEARSVPPDLRPVAGRSSGPPTLGSRRPVGSTPQLAPSIVLPMFAFQPPFAVKQAVRHEQPAEAHASPPHTSTAPPLNCGEADNPAEADRVPTPESGRFHRSG